MRVVEDIHSLHAGLGYFFRSLLTPVSHCLAAALEILFGGWFFDANAKQLRAYSYVQEDMSEAFPPPPMPPGEGALIVPGSPPAQKRKKKIINLLNRTPSPVILEDYGALEHTRCTVGGPGIAGGIVGIATSITVTARDARGVHIREGGKKFVLYLKHPSKGSVSKTYECVDHGDGHYTFTGVRADLKGMHQVRLLLDPVYISRWSYCP